MSIEKVEQKIIELAHEFVNRFGKEVLELSYDELIAYIAPYFDYENWLIFKHNEYQMMVLFVKTVKQDLESQNK
jgi:hypothetical protein